jgi:SAM-dependent methyltransferase
MFTSFGYFHDDAENWRVLSEVQRVLKPGGFFLFDFLNREQVISGLEAESERRSGQWQATERRRISGERVLKEVEIRDRRSGETALRYEESVRLFTPAEILAKIGELNFQRLRTWGSYRGEAFDGSASPRFILLLRKDAP